MFTVTITDEKEKFLNSIFNLKLIKIKKFDFEKCFKKN